ncbi:threonine aldolase family protein [Litchfieldella rifensis]|uniref:Threonine aldolase family protein n=1 Tax=Litchfieldella rifensis TaxID=762643 RepID=A0ABV7LW28_9GAMM
MNVNPLAPGRIFASDNASGVHPRVMEALQAANLGHQLGYGNDPYTERVRGLFKEVFGPGAETFLLLNGTGSNVLALKGMLRSHEAVCCSHEAHLLVDECGAPENVIGCKLVALPVHQGKLDLPALEAHIRRVAGIQHHSQPRVVSIAQATERGTVYHLDELQAIVAVARRHGLLVHMDGARIANAAVALGISFKEMTADVGIDVVSFGGTKNGLMMAEALVVLNPALVEAYPFIRKQGMQLASKHRFLAAQYLAYFEGDLWRENAAHANAMARYLADGLSHFDEIALTAPVEANLVFATLPREWIQPLQQACNFNVWDAARAEVRLIASFDTTREDIDAFLAEIHKLNQC